MIIGIISITQWFLSMPLLNDELKHLLKYSDLHLLFFLWYSSPMHSHITNNTSSTLPDHVMGTQSFNFPFQDFSKPVYEWWEVHGSNFKLF
jgi:hypothetical protein